MFPANFGYVAARSVDEALQLLAKHGDEAKLLAGGHSLIPAMKLRLQSPQTLIDLGTIPALRGIKLDGNHLAIGALTVHADVAASDLVRKHVPGLSDAAHVIGDMQVRNRGTIGGSLAHADPSADYPAVMVALGAEIDAIGAGGKRKRRHQKSKPRMFHKRSTK
jgi:carbon-monoxide dehydrogenase medium subunit